MRSVVVHRVLLPTATPTKHFVRRRQAALTSSISRCAGSSCFCFARHERRSYSRLPNKASYTDADSHGQIESSSAPLSILPLSSVLRSLGTSAVSSSPLLPLSLRILGAIAYSTNSLLSVDHNPLLRYVLNKSLYAQFCAGDKPSKVRGTIAQVKSIGFTGVVLAYAKESPMDTWTPTELPDSAEPGEETQSAIDQEIVPWTENMLKTVRMVEPGDFAAFKFTGAGRLALYQLTHGLPPSLHLSKSIDDICELARERRVRLLFDGEQDMLQDGIDAWTIRLAGKYNTTPGSATIFGTYQAYKKSMPIVLSQHLAEAQKRKFTLGVKLVRGAYLGSDLRDRFYDSKADTDACYDNSAASVLTRQWNSTLQGTGEFPHVSLMLATHNARSVRRAYTICNAGDAKSELFFAQLQGMADEIGCELVEENQSARDKGNTTIVGSALPVYKYMAWGTTGECMKYLLRRAQENRDAVKRTRDDRDALWAELVRRIKTLFSRGKA